MDDPLTFWGRWDFKKEKHIGKEQKIYNLTLLILIKFLGQFWKINTEISYEKKKINLLFFFHLKTIFWLGEKHHPYPLQMYSTKATYGFEARKHFNAVQLTHTEPQIHCTSKYRNRRLQKNKF